MDHLFLFHGEYGCLITRWTEQRRWGCWILPFCSTPYLWAGSKMVAAGSPRITCRGEATTSSRKQLPVTRQGPCMNIQYVLLCPDNFRDQVHLHKGRWERERRGEEGTHPQTNLISQLLTKHLPFPSTQINPSRAGSVCREGSWHLKGLQYQLIGLKPKS